MNVGNRFIEQKALLEKGIFSMSMTEIKPMLCGKSHGDACVCIDCSSKCPFGKRAIELLEKETRVEKPMNKKRAYDISRKIEAMQNYVETMTSSNPTKHLKTKFNISNDKTAKNKLYQWQHNYGTNLASINSQIKDMQEELNSIKDNIGEQFQEPAVVFDVKEEAEVEKKPTKRQEEKISQNHLEKMREDLEKEYLDLEKKIADCTKAIQEYENRMNSITDNITAIRNVLAIFKKEG